MDFFSGKPVGSHSLHKIWIKKVRPTHVFRHPNPGWCFSWMGKKQKLVSKCSDKARKAWKKKPQPSMYFRANLWTSLIWGHVGAVMGPGMMEYPTHHQDRSREMCNKFGIHREQSQHQNEDRNLVFLVLPKKIRLQTIHPIFQSWMGLQIKLPSSKLTLRCGVYPPEM